MPIKSEDRTISTLKDLGLAAPPKDGPAVLIFDIETAPSLVWVWRQFDTNVIDTEQDWYMLSFAYKWLGQKGTRFVSIAQDPAFYEDSPNDHYIVERLHALLDAADATVAHNADKFDRRKANARFLIHDMRPTSPYRSIDTLKEARRHFALYSNSLKEINRYLGLSPKMPNEGFDLWRGCMRGDPAKWRIMERYNRQDVKALEVLYLKLRPWIGHVGSNMGLNLGFWAKGETVCKHCGSLNLIKNGTKRTSVSEYQGWECKDCGGFGTSRLRESQKDDGGVVLT
jgi:hypothetical protein